MKILLGSSSPRRAEILAFFTLPFEVVSPPFDERSLLYGGDPISYVETLSKEKALSLLPQCADAALITADTIVHKDGDLFNKPSTMDEAKAFLQQLSGSWHSVFTSVSLSYQGEIQTLTTETKILFHPLNPSQIQAYLASARPLDKAGGYAIQGAGSLIVQKIEGCYYNVLGLPVSALATLLKRPGIDLWQQMKPV